MILCGDLLAFPEPFIAAIPTSSIREEAALIQRCRQGDTGAFDVLVLRYQDRIYNAVFRVVGNADDAGDVTQEAFVKAFRQIGRFEANARFSTWLYRIAVNTAISFCRKPAHRERTASFGGVDDDGAAPALEPVSLERAPWETFHLSEAHAAIQGALAALDEQSRVVVVLRDVEGLSYEEIAAVIEIPLGTVRSRLHRARLTLREKLKVWQP